MNFLITGGAGFIGSNFLNIYVNEEKENLFVCYDKLTYAAYLEGLKPCQGKKNFVFVEGDICDKNKAEETLDKYHIDGIINFAAESHVDRSIKDPQVFLKSNILGVGVLLDLCVKKRIKRFLQVSTDEVYGDSEGNKVFDETSPLHPSSPYSASKAAADLLTLSYIRTYGIDALITRSSNNFGPNQHPEKLIPTVIKALLGNRPVPIYGDGSNTREWIYVDDNCRGIMSAFLNGKSGEIYDIASPISKTNLEIVKEIGEILHLEPKIEFVKDRPGHDRSYSISGKKAKEQLGFTAISDFKESLVKTVEHYKKRFMA